MVSKFILPKRDKETGEFYLSWSQIKTWKKSKREYIRQYFLGEGSSKALIPYGDFGNLVGEALEDYDFSKFSDEEGEFLKTVPRYDEFEREVELKMGWFKIKGYIDTNSKEERSDSGMWVKKIIDYKTGEIERRLPEYQSSEYWQLPIYAAAMRQEYGKLPDDIKVIIIQRDGNAFKGEKLTLGSEYAEVDIKLSNEDCNRVLGKIREVAEEISAYYTAYLRLNGIL